MSVVFNISQARELIFNYIIYNDLQDKDKAYKLEDALTLLDRALTKIKDNES